MCNNITSRQKYVETQSILHTCLGIMRASDIFEVKSVCVSIYIYYLRSTLNFLKKIYYYFKMLYINSILNKELLEKQDHRAIK